MKNANRAEAVIDLAALRSNLRALQQRAGSAQVMSVVKADAYGHGMLPCAFAALDAGVRWLGTAKPEEALALRAAGITPDRARVLCWLWLPESPWAEAVEADLDITASGVWALERVADAVRSVRARRDAEGAAGAEPDAEPVVARVQLKIDTGLGRNGAQPHDWAELVAAARRSELDGLIRVTGVWSHLACADEPGHPSIRAQLDAFAQALTEAEAAGLRPEVRHIANSPALLTLPEAHYDLVRPGLAQYGLSPVPQLGGPGEFGLRPVMTLHAPLASVKTVAAGHGVSYGHTYTTPGETTLALVPLGYADGIPRHASSAGPVLIGGKWRTVAGRVAMDQFVVDLGGDQARVGDPAVLFGSGEHGEPTAEDWASAAGTISYEIVTRIGGRVPRRYVDAGD